jgi:hypothetical protein
MLRIILQQFQRHLLPHGDPLKLKLKVMWEVWLHYCVPRFVVQRECNANTVYTSLQFFFFQTIHAGNAVSGQWFTNNECGKTIVQGTLDAGINNVIYMELYWGPKMANGTCGKTIVTGRSRCHCIRVCLIPGQLSMYKGESNENLKFLLIY